MRKEETVSVSRMKQWRLPKNLKSVPRKSCKPGKPRKVSQSHKVSKPRKEH